MGKSERAAWGQVQFDLTKICSFCKGRGHWKADCPEANVRRGKSGGQVKSAALVKHVSPALSCSLEESNFSDFISGGSVSLVGSDVAVLVKNLRDTGAFNSYIHI